GEPTMNLLRTVHSSLRVELRAALFRATQTGMTVETFGTPASIDGVSLLVDIRVSPADELVPDCLLVVFSARPVADDDPHPPPRAEPEPAVRQLEQEVDQIKTRLRYTVEQYEASTEELKSSNEELQAMNEELRSALEELETSREELQAINEELTTVNHELKTRAEQLAAANSDIQNLMSSTAIPTVFLDRDLKVMRYTPSAVALFRLIPGDLGRPLTDLKLHLDYPELRKDAEQVLAQLTPIEREVGDDQGRWYIVRVLPYRTTEDRIGGVVFTFIDITGRRQSESALYASTREAHDARQDAEFAANAKDDILASLSHELRTPLNPVLLTMSAMETDASLPAGAREQLTMMRRNVELEARLIDDLLDATRISRGKLELKKVPVDVHEAAEWALRIVSDELLEKKLVLEVKLDAVEHHVSVDPARLQQVFWNLLKNAIKFTHSGGHIVLSTINPSPGRIAIAISDNGIGIAPECLERIFVAFDQGNLHGRHGYGGLGLGLTISKAIVDLHGGKIHAESPGPGKGASFTVELLTVSSGAESPANVPSGASEPAPPLRLLVVEDDKTTLTAMSELLRRDGHIVLEARSLEEALKLAEQERPDLVVSDLGLPDGTGMELMSALKNKYGLTGIALSGYGSPSDVKQTTAAGFAAHLVKPVGIVPLRQAIRRVWEASKSGAS
ncbi:MAG TPA: PAS domain-containing protein, partial [Verrucomicrobiales bacterium]|nr:PAS domain-containing protein [Verrucomicrobiales bacterium]